MINKGLFTSASCHWATPKALYAELDREFHFNDDPCPLGGRITPKTATRRRKQAQGTAEDVKNSNGCCSKCGKPFDYFNRPGRHHVVPRGLGGSDSPENQRLEGWCCCHEKEKGGLTAAAKVDQERRQKAIDKI